MGSGVYSVQTTRRGSIQDVNCKYNLWFVPFVFTLLQIIFPAGL